MVAVARAVDEDFRDDFVGGVDTYEVGLDEFEGFAGVGEFTGEGAEEASLGRDIKFGAEGIGGGGIGGVEGGDEDSFRGVESSIGGEAEAGGVAELPGCGGVFGVIEGDG